MLVATCSLAIWAECVRKNDQRACRHACVARAGDGDIGSLCRFVLNVLQRDDLEGEEQAQSSPAAAQGSSTAGLALGSFSGLQMDGLQVQVLPEGTQEDDADIKVCLA